MYMYTVSSSRTLKWVKFDLHLMQYARLLIHSELLRLIALHLVDWNLMNFVLELMMRDKMNVLWKCKWILVQNTCIQVCHSPLFRALSNEDEQYQEIDICTMHK